MQILLRILEFSIQLRKNRNVNSLQISKQCKELLLIFICIILPLNLFARDINLDETKSLVEKYFGNWQKSEVERKKFDKPAAPNASSIDFVHKEGAVQSVINFTYPIELKS